MGKNLLIILISWDHSQLLVGVLGNAFVDVFVCSWRCRFLATLWVLKASLVHFVFFFVIRLEDSLSNYCFLTHGLLFGYLKMNSSLSSIFIHSEDLNNYQEITNTIRLLTFVLLHLLILGALCNLLVVTKFKK